MGDGLVKCLACAGAVSAWSFEPLISSNALLTRACAQSLIVAVGLIGVVWVVDAASCFGRPVYHDALLHPPRTTAAGHGKGGRAGPGCKSPALNYWSRMACLVGDRLDELSRDVM